MGRLIHFDRRGTGLSDPVPLDQLPDLQTQVGDAVAVLRAAQSGGAAVVGLNDGTIVAALLAAARPELCRSLVLFTLTSGHTLAAGMAMESIEEVIELIQASAVTDDSGVELLAPSRVGDEPFDRQLARLQRFSGLARTGTTTGRQWRPTSPTSCPRSGRPPLCSTGQATRSFPLSSLAWPRR